jgi:hypothetical protein
LTSGPALVSAVFLQHRQNESLLEFAHCLGVQDVALVHLQDECFELISHGILLSFEKLTRELFSFANFRFEPADTRGLLVLLFTA